MNDPDGRRISLILDTSAILAFCRGSLHVGEVLGQVGDDDTVAALPAACLVEAFQSVIDRDHLDLLASHAAAVVVADGPEKWLPWAAMYSLTGSFDAAAAALAFVDYDCPVLSARPELYEQVGGGRMVIPVVD